MDNHNLSNIENIDLSDPAYYNNRELSWLAFNERVLEETIDESNPLLERLKFMAIFSSNLDEFFMVRVGGLKDQVKAGFNKPENKAGLTPKEQLTRIAEKTHVLTSVQDKTFQHLFLPKLAQEGIKFLSIDQLNKEQAAYIAQVFNDRIFPVLTPLAIDAYRPFPKLLNKRLNLAVQLKEDEQQAQHLLAIVQVPNVIERFIALPTENGRCFVFLEDVISHFIGQLFSGYQVVSVSLFRITRNADMTIHEEGARDLLKEIEKELRKRKWGATVRFEYQQGRMNKQVLRFLRQVLEIEDDDIYTWESPLDFTFLFKFVDELAPDFEHLVYEALIPQTPQDLIGEDDVLEAALKKDLFFHHPFESFTPIIDFISSAADDPKVLAIKQTLYRVSGQSPIIEALVRAAEKGKQVTVLVELKARFDEENNIHWAKMLEKAGVHVIYGITGLKTHSKITLVVRRDEGELQRFVHLGTGNYNESTAKTYTDMSLLTTDEAFGIDATNFFNHLSGYSEPPQWHHFNTSPLNIRKQVIDLIEEEIETHRQSGQGRIIAKMNSLTDKKLIMSLYEASQAGVKIDLIVRGICCLRPGIPGVSDNISVRSIVGRFLEHSRIFYFHHGGAEKLFLSSADWMTRNMEKRIEIMFPIYQQDIKKRIKEILAIYLRDNVKARVQDQEGIYHYVSRGLDEEPIQSQLTFFYMAYVANEDEE